MSEIVNLEQKNSETPVNSVNTNKNTIQLEVYYFSSSGSMIDFAQSPASREVGKSGPVLLMFNDRIYYMVDHDGPHSFPEIASKLVVDLFGLAGLKNNVTTAQTVRYHDPNVEIFVNANYVK